MGRKVFVTSDMCTDEKLIDVAGENSEAAVLWPWILMSFDDWGRAEASPKRLKAKIFPMFPSVTVALIEEALRLYNEFGLIKLYQVNGKQYMSIDHEKWFKYQTHIRTSKREKDESRIPAPPTDNSRKCAQVRDNERICTPSPTPSPTPTKDLKDLFGESGVSGDAEPEPPEPPVEPDETNFNFPQEYWDKVRQIDTLPENKQLDMLVVEYGKKYPAQRKKFGTGGVVKARESFKNALDLDIPASDILKEILFDTLDEGEPEPKPWEITGFLIQCRGLEQTRAQMNYEMARQLEREVIPHEQRNPP